MPTLAKHMSYSDYYPWLEPFMLTGVVTAIRVEQENSPTALTAIGPKRWFLHMRKGKGSNVLFLNL